MKLLCLLFLICASNAPAASGTGIKGTVTDTHGVVLPAGLKAHVYVHWDASGADIGLKTNVGISSDVSLEMDSQGHFQAELPPGFYDVFISAFGFSPTCRKIRVKPGEVVTFNPKLQVDPLVTKELADKPF
jgi:hypothetical protein